MQIGQPYRFIMQPRDEEVLADEATDGIWVVDQFVDERTRVEENGVKYGLKYEGWPTTVSVESKDVQNGPAKTAARKRCLERHKKESEAEGESVKRVPRQRQTPVKHLPRYTVISNEEEDRCLKKVKD